MDRLVNTAVKPGINAVMLRSFVSATFIRGRIQIETVICPFAHSNSKYPKPEIIPVVYKRLGPPIAQWTIRLFMLTSLTYTHKQFV